MENKNELERHKEIRIKEIRKQLKKIMDRHYDLNVERRELKRIFEELDMELKRLAGPTAE